MTLLSVIRYTKQSNDHIEKFDDIDNFMKSVLLHIYGGLAPIKFNFFFSCTYSCRKNITTLIFW